MAVARGGGGEGLRVFAVQGRGGSGVWGWVGAANLCGGWEGRQRGDVADAITFRDAGDCLHVVILRSLKQRGLR